jgi:hypothetical protein
MTHANDLGRLEAAAAIADPIDRARALSGLVGLYEGLVRDAARLRREAIIDALSGRTQEQVAKALGVTPGRISQMRKAAAYVQAAEPVVTGWAAAPGPATARVAICGSRAPGTSAEHIDAAVLALAELLMHRRYAVTHGPVGVGAEVLTRIADQEHPAGLDTVRGIIGHANVVRDAGYVVIIGGGGGTQAEVDTALAQGQRILPMPASGGTAARAYLRLIEDASLRRWLPDDQFSALATAGGASFASIIEAVITGGETHA